MHRRPSERWAALFRRCGAGVTSLFIAACASPRTLPESSTPDRTAVVFSAREIQTIASRPDTAIAYDSVARLISVEGRYNVGVAVVRRQRVGDTTPPDALSHHDITEVYQILEGSGVFVSGGRIVAGTEMRAESRGVQRIVGPSERGTGITGGTSLEVGPGDIIVVPPNTPHGFSRLISRQIVYTVVRFDPHRRLALHRP